MAAVGCRRLSCRANGRLPALLACVLLLPTACRTEARLQEEHTRDLEAEAASPLEVVDFLPPPGVPGVPSNMQPYFFFNRALKPDEALELSVVNGSGFSVSYDMVTDFDDAGVTFLPGGVLYAYGDDANFSMTLTMGGAQADLVTSDFSLPFPAGSIYNMSTDLECTAFGGSSAAAALLDSFFEPGVYPLWLMVVENVGHDTPLPATTRLLIGPAYIRSNGHYRIYRQVGFSTVFPNVRVDADGSFTATLDGAFLPLDTPEKVVLTYLRDLTIRGRFDFDAQPGRIRAFEVAGIPPARSLPMLADQSESYAKAIKMVNLDVDLNGNGEDDASTFAAASEPEEIPPDQVDP